MDNMTLTEEDKNGVYVYSLLETLRRFDGSPINMSIAEEVPMQQAGDVADEVEIEEDEDQDGVE